jgi:hypothetical protein
MSDNPTQIIINHSGATYIFDPAGRAEPIVDLGDEYFDDRRRLVYEYELHGAHQGPRIKIKVVGIDVERDESGQHPSWRSLVWADTDEQIDDIVDDFYHDALFDDLKIQASEAWS